MKIDLHCHTKKVKIGDAITRNVSPDLFKEKIESADIKIAAITNHNHFDLAQFYELKSVVESTCQIWPGIELDVSGLSGKRGHLIVIANPKNVIQFNESVDMMINNQDVNTVIFNLSEVYNKLNSLDVIYIFHFHKTPAVDENDIRELRKLVNDDSRIFSETADNRSLGVFANYGYNVMIGSDVSDWNKYEESTFAELRLPVANFTDLCRLSKRDDTIISTLLNEKQSYQLIAHPYKKIDLPLKIFADMNIIFGQKGTGKSEIIASLYDNLQSQGLDCQLYVGSERDDAFKSFTKINDLKRDLSKVNASECCEEFGYLFSYVDKNPTLLTDYINWGKTKDNNRNKSRMKITDATTLPILPKTSYKTFKENKIICENILREIQKVNLEDYISKEESQQLVWLLNQLKDSAYSKFLEQVINCESERLTNYSINHIKALADKNSNTKSRPSNTGFIDFAECRIHIKQNVKRILNNITDKEYCEKNSIGTLENKGTIYIQNRYRMLCKESRTDEFKENIGILKNIKELLEDVKENWFNCDIFIKLLKLKEICTDASVYSAKNFLGLSKQIITEDNNEYKPSSGEQSILLLQKVLRTDSDAYFLDEPELGMGNSYIDSTIRPQLVALAKQQKVVVVATHNANIAVRTLPYTSIFRTHENGTYNTYVGNPFSDQLVNICNPDDVKSWTSESMHTLEGGHDAFYERKDIYESNSN